MMGASGFGAEDDPQLLGEINMTPLVDVMLVLLIVFMVTLPALYHAAQVRLPQASSTPMNEAMAQVDVRIDADGVLRWNGAALDTAALQTHLREVARQQLQPQLRLYADRAARYAAVAELLAAAQRAGVEGVAFVTAATPPSAAAATP